MAIASPRRLERRTHRATAFRMPGYVIRGRAAMTRARAAVAFVVLATVVAAGCGNGDSNDQAAPSVDDVTSTSSQRDAAMEGLAGRYAHFDVVAYEGKIMNAMIISYGLTDFDVVDGELITHDSFCYSEFRSNQPISVNLSDAATQAIRPNSTPVAMTLDGDRVHISRPETPTGIGIHLENPVEDALPTDPNDPRIADDDGDGKPGVTATISVAGDVSGEIYIARREIFSYEVDEQRDGSLEGVVKDRSEQLIIDATDDIFTTPDPWTQHPDRSKSPIILRPVERSWDCAQLRSERDSLFPPTPSVDY
jgi:hypothetical protein